MTTRRSLYLPQGDYLRGKEMLMIDDVAKTLFVRCPLSLTRVSEAGVTARLCYDVAEAFLHARLEFLQGYYDDPRYDVNDEAGN